MTTRLKLLPVTTMLLAGAATSVITYLLDYDKTVALWLIIGMLLLFYILGVILQRVIHKFEVQIAEEEAKKAEEEGKVVEKEGAAGGESEGDNSGETLEQQNEKQAAEV